MSSTKPLASFLIAYSNSEFTNPHEVVLPDAPQDCRSHFTHMGAKYSGFESRRHTTTRMGQKAFTYDHDAHDWLVIGYYGKRSPNGLGDVLWCHLLQF